MVKPKYLYVFLSLLLAGGRLYAGAPPKSLSVLLRELSARNEVSISFSPSYTDVFYPQDQTLTPDTDGTLSRILEESGFGFEKIADSRYYVYGEKAVPAPQPVEKPAQKPAEKPAQTPPARIVLPPIAAVHKPVMSFPVRPLPQIVIPAPVPVASPSPVIKPPTPRFAVKTNLLYDATSTINLGVEMALSRRWTLDVSANYNPWTFSDNRKMKHWLIQPEVRWWTCTRFSGHFFGLHGHYARYNWGGMLPWGFRTGKMFGSIENPNILAHRYEGWLAGAGVSYGYHWILGNRWGLEAEIGAGYAYLEYDKFRCEKCGEKIARESKNYFGPTKAAITLIFLIK